MGILFRKERSDSSAAPKAVEVYNPYLAARKEWDERYGELITRARNWRTFAMISALAALLATIVCDAPSFRTGSRTSAW